MLSAVKTELGGSAEDALNEDQIAAAELVAAAAEVEAANSGSRSGTPAGSTILTSSAGQRIIQVVQRPTNFGGGGSVSASSVASRIGQLRPLQQVQLGGGSSGSASGSIYNTNTAVQYGGSSLSGPTLIKSTPDFGATKLLPSGASILTSNLTSSTNLFSSVSQTPQFVTASGVSIASNNVAAAAAAASAAAASQGGANGPPNSQSRKPCNCNKSHCLKLYCDCFAQGQLCQNCNCTNCMNNLQYEEDRARAIKMTLDRNPMAFHPKIGRGEGERKHTKGCNCKKSGCLKNYCECYEAKISCTDLCRCQGCKNTEDGMERRSLMRLSMMSQAMKSRQQVHSRKSFVGPAPETLPHNFITWEVAEACCGCMLAQADDAERRDMLPAAQERIILEEFGRCLGQIVESACKAQPLPSYAPGATVALPGTGHSAASLGLHRAPVGMSDLEVAHGARLHHGAGGSSGGDENVIVDV